MLRQFVLIVSRGNKAQPNLNEGTEVCAAQTKFGNRVPRWHSLSECKSSFRRHASGGWSASYVEPHIARNSEWIRSFSLKPLNRQYGEQKR